VGRSTWSGIFPYYARRRPSNSGSWYGYGTVQKPQGLKGKELEDLRLGLKKPIEKGEAISRVGTRRDWGKTQQGWGGFGGEVQPI